jgi:RNA polymerase sigma factor (sigma-70 family)
MVEGLCRGLLRNAAEAEDAAQQTFLSAYRALIGGTEPREPAAWLAAIARNECLARIRSRMREPLPVDGLEGEEARDDPVDDALRRADLDALWAAIGELPQQQRDALLLREFGGLSYRELAVALGVSRPAVESLLFRARTTVRAHVKEAFASFGWLSDAVARLASAGGAAKIGSVPVVAKVVTAGVGVAVVAGTAVVGERRMTPSRPHRTQHHVTVQQPAAPQPAEPVGAAIAPAAVAHIVREVRASKAHRVDDRSKAREGEGREADDVAAEPHARAAGHARQEATGRSGKAGNRGRHASRSEQSEARTTLTLQEESGDANAPDDPAVTDLLPQDGRGLPVGD